MVMLIFVLIVKSNKSYIVYSSCPVIFIFIFLLLKMLKQKINMKDGFA